MTKITDLYSEVGSGLHKAQLAEHNVVSVYILLSRTGSATKIRETEEAYWSKMTLGQLLNPLINSDRLPEDAKLFLDTFRKARNHLAHSFFVSNSEFWTGEGVDMLLKEIAAIQDVFDRVLHLFENLLSDLARSYNIDAEEIRAQARLLVANIESQSSQN